MNQSEQDDTYDLLHTFVECVFFNLMLAAAKRRLNDDEVYLLQRATELCKQLHPAPLAWDHVRERPGGIVGQG